MLIIFQQFSHVMKLRQNILSAGTSKVAHWVKNPPAMWEMQEMQFDPWVGTILQKTAGQPTPVFLPRESHRQRSLAGYSPRGHKELDKTEVTDQHIRYQHMVAYDGLHGFLQLFLKHLNKCPCIIVIMTKICLFFVHFLTSLSK